MKTVIISIIGIGSLFLVLSIQSNINEQTWEREELEDSMTTAMEQTLSEVVEKNSYGIADRNEMMAAFLQGMLYRIDRDVDLTVKIHDMDYDLGQMDVEATAVYPRDDGGYRQISVRRKMVFATAG